MIFQRLIWAALVCALLVGSVHTVLQQWQAVPIILAAEVYEDHKVEAPAHAHGHDDEAWAPADGLERSIWTWVASVLHAFAMALLLYAAMAVGMLRGSPRSVWLLAAAAAAAGWLSLHLWPSLGLQAEVPGMDAAPLGARQAWWALAVSGSAAGCAALAWMRSPWRWLVAVVLLAVPYAVGAPQLGGDPLAGFGPQVQAQLRQLGQQFVVVTHLLALAFWACMGLVGGWTFARWVRPALLAQLASRANAPGVLGKTV